ncbi:MAG: hypothetical protein LBL83_00715 [Clostridiales bacterium]|nr:hypothetical protein [Clostridiales bacterium]
MHFVLLGIFDSVFNWVLNKIISPVFQVVAGWLSSVLEWLFRNVLSDIIEFALEEVFPDLWEMLMELLSDLLFDALSTVFKLIEAIQKGFDVLIGLTPVTYKPSAAAAITDQSLLEVMLSQSSLKTAFFGISIAAVALAFLAAIYATIRSMLDFDMENKRPVGQVMKSFFKSGLTFLLVPVLVFFMVYLSGIVLRTFDRALGEGQGSVGRTIFLVVTLDAAKSPQNPTSFTDQLRKPYWEEGKDYTNADLVKEDFDLVKIDYITAFAAAGFALIIMAMCIVIFVQRIFEILMLYVVAPFFVAPMPIDDGERFGKWREAFIGKVFSGFGAAIGMRLYLMVLPMVMTSDFTFYSGDSTMDYVIKMLFALGGAWAVYKSTSMISSLLNAQAAQSEAAAGLVGAGVVMGGASMVMGGASMLKGAIADRLKGMGGDKDGKDGDGDGGGGGRGGGRGGGGSRGGGAEGNQQRFAGGRAGANSVALGVAIGLAMGTGRDVRVDVAPGSAARGRGAAGGGAPGGRMAGGAYGGVPGGSMPGRAGAPGRQLMGGAAGGRPGGGASSGGSGAARGGAAGGASGRGAAPGGGRDGAGDPPQVPGYGFPPQEPGYHRAAPGGGIDGAGDVPQVPGYGFPPQEPGYHRTAPGGDVDEAGDPSQAYGHPTQVLAYTDDENLDLP